jgi:hypothetical protein
MMNIDGKDSEYELWHFGFCTVEHDVHHHQRVSGRNSNLESASTSYTLQSVHRRTLL